MSNYSADEIRDLVLEKGAEKYFGEIVLYFAAGGVTAFKDSKMNKKADEETLRKQKAGNSLCPTGSGRVNGQRDKRG